MPAVLVSNYEHGAPAFVRYAVDFVTRIVGENDVLYFLGDFSR